MSETTQQCFHVVCHDKVEWTACFLQESGGSEQSGSVAGHRLGVQEDKESQRVCRKLQVLSWRETHSAEVGKSFIVHHLQHRSIQFHPPSEEREQDRQFSPIRASPQAPPSCVFQMCPCSRTPELHYHGSAELQDVLKRGKSGI